jgi:hypothetical protein
VQRPFKDVDLGAIAAGGDGALPHVQRLLSLLLLATVEMADADARDAVLQRLMGLPEPAQDALMSLIEGLMPEVQGAAAAAQGAAAAAQGAAAAAQGADGETDGAEVVEAGATARAADPAAGGPLLSPRPSRGLTFARTPLGASGLPLSGRRGAAGDLRGILSTARRARVAAAGGSSPGGGAGFTPAQLRALKSPLGAFAARCMEAAAPVPRLAAAAAEAAATEGGWASRARSAGGSGSGAAVSSAINAAGGVSGPSSPVSGSSLPSSRGASVRGSSASSASAVGASGDLAAHNRLLQEEIVSQTDIRTDAQGACGWAGYFHVWRRAGAAGGYCMCGDARGPAGGYCVCVRDWTHCWVTLSPAGVPVAGQTEARR